MKHLLSILLLSGIYVNVISQSNVSIDIVIGGDVSYRHVTNPFVDVTTLDEALYYDSRSRDKPIINSRFGAFYNQRIGKRQFLKIGLMYSAAGYRQGAGDTTNIKRYFYNPLCPLNVNTSNLFPERSDRHRFIEIPLLLRLENRSKTMGLFTEFGFAQAFYLNTKSIVSGSNSNVQDNGEAFIKQNPFIGIASLGFNLKANGGIQIFTQASIRYFITDLGNSRFGEHLYNGGIEVGVRRMLK